MNQKTTPAMTYSQLILKFCIVINYYKPVEGSISKLQTVPAINHVNDFLMVTLQSTTAHAITHPTGEKPLPLTSVGV